MATKGEQHWLKGTPHFLGQEGRTFCSVLSGRNSVTSHMCLSVLMFWHTVQEAGPKSIQLAFHNAWPTLEAGGQKKNTFGTMIFMVWARDLGGKGAQTVRSLKKVKRALLAEPPPSSSEWLTDFCHRLLLFCPSCLWWLPWSGSVVHEAPRFLLSPAMTHRVLLLPGTPGTWRGALRGRRRVSFESK